MNLFSPSHGNEGRNRISVVVPVLDESAIIDDLLLHLSGLSFNDEIVVVDGDPAGATLRAIRRPGVRGIVSPPGRGVQLNCGARASRGDILLFLHADTRLPPSGLRRIRETLADPAVTGGAFDLGIDSRRLCFRLVERIASLRSRVTRVPYGDQAIFIRRKVFFELGGFRPFPIMEDVDLMRRLRRSGRKIVFLPLRVSTSARRWAAEGVAFTTLRNWTLALLFSAGVSPHRLARLYRTVRARHII